MASANSREIFVKQLETIVEGIKQNLVKVIHFEIWNKETTLKFSLIKMENKKSEEKNLLDKLNDKYIGLVENKRNYYKNLKDFQEVKLKI